MSDVEVSISDAEKGSDVEEVPIVDDTVEDVPIVDDTNPFNQDEDEDDYEHSFEHTEQQEKPKDDHEFYLKVSVSDPDVVEVSSLKKFVVYTITTQTNMPQFEGDSFFVKRRFKDFLWLHKVLVENHPGIAVPPLPEKVAVGRFHEAVVEARRRELERFLDKVTFHPSLKEDVSLRLFLQTTNDEEIGNNGGFGKAFSNFTQHISKGVDKLTTTVQVDDWTFERKNYLNELRFTLNELENMLGKQSMKTKELNYSFGEVGKHSRIIANLDHIPEKLRRLADSFGQLNENLCTNFAIKPEEGLMDFHALIKFYVKMVDSVLQALDKRIESEAMFSAAAKREQKKKAELEKLEGKGKDDKVAACKDIIKTLEHETAQAQRDSEDMSDRFALELERFHADCEKDLRDGMKEYAEQMIQQHLKATEYWRSLAENL
eukprot:GCRY01001612.1.p1 GENE.GCRY01001612.1~~GCRY01001612.1.p1  ORF type:complete len:431 (+),score=88.28 GCRY01001612.1:173-1465(+)